MVVLESAFDHASSIESSSLPPAMQLSVDTSSAMTIPHMSSTPGAADMNAAVAACSMKMLPKRFINLHNYFNPLSSLSLKKQIKQVAVSVQSLVTRSGTIERKSTLGKRFLPWVLFVLQEEVEY
ncbi:uncharacterized protein LOC113468183 [Diaphorina citri]|uniref:Uncharacterized protein LOC113468183 n=1 Tax=Diaphorina citri TaxID=121845 RepID=A0A3Q0IWV1_DIACI|nr:uncharacterized protein LOC113468183 [Diaphorina citri]